MSKHTPAPWKIGNIDSRKIHVSVAEKGCINTICVVHGLPQGVSGSKKANASLIAAAPELLEVLIQARGWIGIEMDSHCEDDVALWSQINAAIAKARGEA